MTKKILRVEYGKFLVEMGKRYSNLVVLDGDLKESTQTIQFQQHFPERFIDCGVAEQNMFGVAAGLALGGKLPIVHTFACFASLRACEQIRTSICYPKLNVKIVVSHGGISAGSAGPTHHAIEDIAIMRAIPNMTVLVPGDSKEMRQVVEKALAYKGPVYIRLVAGDFEDVYTDEHQFSIGKATILRDGNEVTIITTGTMMQQAVLAADVLKRDYGIAVRVIQMASIKPIDEDLIYKEARKTKKIMVIEEHNIIGGIGSAVCEIVTKIPFVTEIKRIGINDQFNDSSFAYQNVIERVKEILFSQ
ncbi:MAG: transketolase family protein [Candidatus Omnitrophica bacterium]|nr:transketolase family protein [Candidatus Omnitrophota bacterium]